MAKNRYSLKCARLAMHVRWKTKTIFHAGILKGEIVYFIQRKMSTIIKMGKVRLPVPFLMVAIFAKIVSMILPKVVLPVFAVEVVVCPCDAQAFFVFEMGVSKETG